MHCGPTINHIQHRTQLVLFGIHGTLSKSVSIPVAEPPADGPLFPVPKQKRYLTWEPDMGGLNNIRMQVWKQHSGRPYW